MPASRCPPEAPLGEDGEAFDSSSVQDDPLGAPRRSFERIGEILRFVNDLAILEFHDADRVAGLPQVHDRVFRDPQVAGSEESLDLESRRLAGMMAAQSLQIASAEDSLAGLRIVA